MTKDKDSVPAAAIEEIMGNYGVTPERAREMYRERFEADS